MSSRSCRYAIKIETALQSCVVLCTYVCMLGTFLYLNLRYLCGKLVWRMLVSFSSNQVKSLLKKCIKCGKLGCCDNKSADVSKFKQHCVLIHNAHMRQDKSRHAKIRPNSMHSALGKFRPQNAMRSCYYVCTMLIITYVFVSSWWKSDFICWLA